MGIVYRNGDFNKLATKIRHIPDEIIDDLDPLMERTAKTGEELMKAFIRTRGTARSGKRGRIDTGKMLDSVTSDTDRTRTTLAARWGWLTEREKYFLYQEDGFRHAMTNQDVEAMHALLDSFFQNRELFFADMSKKFRRRR